jgi:hypothetical protein
LKKTATVKNLARVGDWLRVDILARDREAEVRVNGKMVLTLRNEDFPPSPGGIGLTVLPLNDLDARAPAASFRNLEIKELPPAGPR